MNENLQKALFNIKINGELKRAGIGADQILMSDGQNAATVIASILADIANLPTDSGIDAKIKSECDALYNKILGKTDADTTINEAFDTLKEVAAWIDTHGEAAAQITTDVTQLKTAVQALQSAATNVEASAINGNIKVDGQEITVYTPPETISADKITETSTKNFVTQAEKDDWNSRGAVHVGTTAPENMKNGDVFFQIVE